MSHQSLGQKAAVSGIWQLSSSILQAIIRFVASIFLARALLPSDFGIFGLAILFKDFLLHIGAFGVGSAVIAKKDITKQDLNTCFYIISIIRFLLFCIAFFGAPFVGLFFKNLQVVNVVKFISFSFLIQIIGFIPHLLLLKELRYKEINIISLVSILIESSFAVFFVYKLKLSYWSLPLAMLIAVFFSNLMYLYRYPWFPSFYVSRDSFKYLFNFGLFTLMSTFSNYLKGNIDFILIGRLLGTYQLGLYEFAYRIPTNIAGRIIGPISAIVLPFLSKIQNNNSKIFHGYLKIVVFSSLLIFPLISILISICDILIPLLWGDKWIPIILPMRILCIVVLFSPILHPISSIFYVKHRPDLFFKMSFCSLIITVILLVPCIKFLGLIGAPLAILISNLLLIFLSHFYYSRLLNINFIAKLTVLFPIVFSSILAVIVSYFIKKFFLLNSFSILFALFFAIISFFIVYLFSIVFFFRTFLNQILRDMDLYFPKFHIITKNIRRICYNMKIFY